RNIMRDNMIVNVTDLPGHAMGMDLNIEHIIRYLKTLFAAKGIYANWERLGDISAAVNYLQLIKTKVTRSMHTNYQGSMHKVVDTCKLVWHIANKAWELHSQEVVLVRDGQSSAKYVPNLCTKGQEKFTASSLATFNKKVQDMAAGRVVLPENDEMPVPEFAEFGDGEEDNENGEGVEDDN
ncbi:hypothetical protein L208DRAFT_1250356, partial [Tricholoma matsutake]